MLTLLTRTFLDFPLKADPRPPAPVPTPRRISNSHNVPVVVTTPPPLVLAPQLHAIPLTVENMRYHEDVASNERDDDSSKRSPLSVFDSLEHVQLTREGSGAGVDFCLRNAKGERVLTAADEVGCCGDLLGRNRPFDITVCDSAFTEV